VFDARGAVVAKALKQVAVSEPAPGRVEQDPEALVASLREAVADVAVALGPDVRRLTAAGLATQRSSIACWDRETGAALSPVISWQDRRAHAWLRWFEPQREDVHRRTGLMLSAHYGASKLRWCLDNLPEVAAARASSRLALGPLAGFLLFRLLDERPLLVDAANAARTLLWNIDTGDWDESLCERFGVPAALLPRCVGTRHAFGTLAVGDIAVPLVVATGDQSAALFASGEPRADSAYVNIGTGAFVQRVTGTAPCYQPRLLSGIVLRAAGAAVHVLEGTVNGAGAALAAFAQEHGVADFDARLAEWLARHSEPPLFLNGVGGLGAPFWAADFVSRFDDGGALEQQAIAVAESIVFLIETNLEAMRTVLPAPARIVATGGLAALDGLCRRLADLSALPLYRPMEHEASARGLAFLLAGRPSPWPETGPGTDFRPQPDAALNARYRRWRDAMHRATGV
jgi:glycerol kinase